jgi:periplasmic protein TonB
VRPDIFGEVTNPSPRLGSRSRYTLPASMVAHAAAAIAVIIVPLVATDSVPLAHRAVEAFIAQPALPTPPPPAEPPRPLDQPGGPPAVVSSAAPREAPPTIEPDRPTTASILETHGVVPGGLPDGTITGSNVVIAPPPVPPPPPSQKRPVPVGGVIKEPAKVRHVAPVYPVMAQQARVEGMVIVEAIIGVDGRVKEARVLRSKPLLDDAALEAVRQWVFTPTTLNGVAVPVIMTVTVNFRLN